HLALAHAGEVFPVKEDLLRLDLSGRPRDQLHDREGRDAFAATRLSHEPHRRPPVDGKADAVDRGDNPIVGDKRGSKPPHRQERGLAVLFPAGSFGHRIIPPARTYSRLRHPSMDVVGRPCWLTLPLETTVGNSITGCRGRSHPAA